MRADIVRWILIGVVVVCVGWDIWLAVDGRHGNTISEVIRAMAYEHPMIPFGFGVLIGHWFWAGRNRPEEEEDG